MNAALLHPCLERNSHIKTTAYLQRIACIIHNTDLASCLPDKRKFTPYVILGVLLFRRRWRRWSRPVHSAERAPWRLPETACVECSNELVDHFSFTYRHVQAFTYITYLRTTRYLANDMLPQTAQCIALRDRVQLLGLSKKLSINL